MKKSTLVLIGVLAIMVLIAGIQMFQFHTLTNSLSGVKVSGAVSASASPAPSSSGSGNLPGVLSNLPSQVGGC